MRDLYITNTLSRKKEIFKPVHPGFVGLYVCGPTVYGDAHLGHARPGITYDVLVKLLRHLGYKVRYVRNITDVGHLEHDADEGEDKIAKKARIEQLEPMEVVQEYTIRYHDAMRMLNVAPPSIEPRASGHIIEQIALVKKILDAGFAYESNGSVYFDVRKYNESHHYGVLSGRNLDDVVSGTRELDSQDDKREPYDFALWKKAAPEHIMHWPSPWSEGFPGWHLECSAMSEKYLGREFDIHGGGMDLMFPHHECELAQNTASRGCGGVKYWMHNNMITINGKKMGKSYGNFITLQELFEGTHPLLAQAYTPMTVRFFILQAHYRSTLDFSNEALQAAGKGLKRVMQAEKDLREMASAAEDAFEALVGAVYLDSNFEKARKTIYKWYKQRLEDLHNLVEQQNPKGALQELAAKHGESVAYSLLSQSGPDHSKVFEVEVAIGGISFGKASASSKKSAETKAARMALGAYAKLFPDNTDAGEEEKKPAKPKAKKAAAKPAKKPSEKDA